MSHLMTLPPWELLLVGFDVGLAIGAAFAAILVGLGPKVPATNGRGGDSRPTR
jgi:hypothetical protein